MKDVKQCSISTVAFTMEVDAYDTLALYLESIKEYYRNDRGGEEILSDIEARIAELILATHSAERVVAKPLIDNIIKQMGSADDICSDGEPAQSEPAQERSSDKRSERVRKLYRNVDDAPISGVCSGIAAYVGCDPVLVRIVALMLLLFGGCSLWVYIILWVLVPPALTAREKLEMRGEPVTVNTIRDYYNNLANSESTQSVVSSIVSTVGRILSLIFKIFAALFIVVWVFMMLGLIFSLLAMVVMGSALFAEVSSCVVPFWVAIVGVVMALLVVCILLNVFSHLLNSRKVNGKSIFGSIAILILVIMLILGSVTLFGNGSIRHEIKDAIENSGVNYSVSSYSCDDFDDDHHLDGQSREERLEQLEQIYNN